MITRIRYNGSWAGIEGITRARKEEAMIFHGSRQRESAYQWARETLGDEGRFVDILSEVSFEDLESTPRVECAPCRKVLQNGESGVVSHGICGSCARKQIEAMEAGK